METVICNLCHSASFEALYHLPDYLLERPDVGVTLVRCQQCGLVYQNPRPDLAEMAEHYPAEYESYDPDPGGKQNPRLLQRAVQYGIHKRCRYVTRYKTGGRLLDVGCASGVFLRGMKRFPGWELHGVEISAHAAETARSYGLDVFTGTLENAAFPDQSFEAVTLWDVLEHLHDPKASLSEIHRILKPDGILVLRVPNIDSWDAHTFGRFWAGLDAPRHLYVFGKDTLTHSLQSTGLQIIQMNCGIGSYPTFVLSVRFWMVAKSWKPSTRQVISKALAHPVTRLATAPIFYLSGLGQNGPLLTVVAKKPSSVAII